MTCWKIVLTALALGVAVPATDAAAQVRLSIGGGPSFAVGDLDDEGGDYGVGYHILASAGLRPAALPVGLLIDATWSRFPESTDGFFQAIYGTANAVLGGAGGPYVLGGGGLYSTKVEHEGDSHESESAFGFNVGAGYRAQLPGLGVFVEARFHNTLGDVRQRFIPVTFGFTF